MPLEVERDSSGVMNNASQIENLLPQFVLQGILYSGGWVFKCRLLAAHSGDYTSRCKKALSSDALMSANQVPGQPIVGFFD